MILKVENIGRNSGRDYDFYSGVPAFIAAEEELCVAINNGSNFVGTTLPITGEITYAAELVNPPYSMFELGTRGAVYRIESGSGNFMLNVTHEGLELLSPDGKCEFYPFDIEYEELYSLADEYDEEVPVLLAALGF